MTEGYIIKKLRESGKFEKLVRFTPGRFSRDGIPDLYFRGVDGESYWMELKMNYQKLTPAQAEFVAAEKRAIVVQIIGKRNILKVFHTPAVPSEVLQQVESAICGKKAWKTLRIKLEVAA